MIQNTSFSDLYINAILKYYNTKDFKRLKGFIKKISLRIKHQVLEHLREVNLVMDFNEKVKWFTKYYLGKEITVKNDILDLQNIFMLPYETTNVIIYTLCFEIFNKK
ncbi:hypothetical protein AAJ76_430009908 [Vairimorpha ceranae]|uniref:Uncharacterized protein n=1 Tax=Vairimorpha ceranae TaxID=40302 RepID=A0A0F9WB90_9MICR|nr:hypothetical protein AAJ76_430009908 [Vairimorpha ceranae]KAF5141766.1 hypothetical protein G9O61_00g000490 [Vairimorpha ceranae]KKO74826.1 hypothetical protein AAJ76_430009908 [Vairimorpha ceranae]